MQERELNRVTIGVVNSMDLRGRATADEINRGLRTGKHPARIGGLAAFIAAGVFVALVPMPTRADDDERGGHKETEALEAKVASLQTAVSALQDQVTTLQTQLAAVQSNHALLLGPFVTVDPNPEIGVIGPNITFSGANIHIVSGSGRTDDNGNPLGLGNLIIGYDDDPQTLFAGGPGGGPTLRPG